MNDDQEERIEGELEARAIEKQYGIKEGALTPMKKVTWFPENLNKKEYPRSVLNMHNLLEQISRLNDKIAEKERYWQGIVATKIKLHNNYVDALEKRIKKLEER